MAVTNLHLLQHLDGTVVTKEDISIGVSVYIKTMQSTRIKSTCVFLDNNRARFRAESNTSFVFTVLLDYPDMTLDEFDFLAEALAEISRSNQMLCKQHLSALNKALLLGYAQQEGVMCTSWTDQGIERFGELAARANIN